MPTPSPKRFLLADRDDPNPAIKSAAAIFAVLGAFNLAKAKDIKYSQIELQAILTERIQMLRVRRNANYCYCWNCWMRLVKMNVNNVCTSLNIMST